MSDTAHSDTAHLEPAQRGLGVAVLGPVRAWLDGDELTLGPARQRAVFAVLAGNANRLVSHAELIEAVWGVSAPTTAKGSVYTYISGLRRTLEPSRNRWSAADLLASGPTGYTLRIEAGGLDADRFARLRAEAQEALAAGNPAGAAELLEKALGLWHGEAYGGVGGPFAEVERQRLADLRLATIEQRARLVLDLGGHDDLIAELAGLVRDNPLHEPLHELLMLALHRGGRHTEALAAYRDARRTLVDELGVEPGPALRRLQQQILDDTVPPETPEPGPARLSVLPPHVSRALGEGLTNRPYLGRAREVGLLRDLVGDVRDGRGRSVWIEGEPGIGKTELLTVALADAGHRGCQLAWGTADQLGRRIPLRAVLDSLGLDGAGFGSTDRLITYVRQVCTRGPLVLVMDDLQWADDASVLAWGRLAAATRQLPLLLVAATRPEPSRRELGQLRRGVAARQGEILHLEPLAAADVEQLLGEIVGAVPGPSLRALAPRTAGNPLYAREMATALLRQDAVRLVDGAAEVDVAAVDVAPESLLAAVRGTLSFLTGDTRAVLRSAALLGHEFAVTDVATVTGRSPYDLVQVFAEAVHAHVVVDAGAQLAFRHPFLRQALYDTIPAPLRATLRRHAAEALAGAGATVTRVAEQLTAEPVEVDPWVVDWLVAQHADLIHRAPAVADDLIGKVLDTARLGPDRHRTLLVALVKLRFRLDLSPEQEARTALEIATDPADRAEMRQLLAAMRYRRGHADEAIGLLADAVDDAAVPEIWRVRHRALLANFRRGDIGDLDRAEHAARKVHAAAVTAGEPYAVAHALQTLWLVESIRRNHAAALEHVDRAIAVVSGYPDLAGLYLDLLDNRVFSLQNLDQLDAAEATLRSAAGVQDEARLQVAAAVQYYWAARWDDALAELGTVTDDAPGITFHGMREPGAAALLMHGVAALVSARRDDRASAAVHLDAAEAQFLTSSAERESCDFLLVAKALTAEQDGRPEEALELLMPVLRPAYAQMTLRHQWLPEATRLALDVGRPDIAAEALDICAAEAAKETMPARAYAAEARCRALVTGDPDAALAAAAHYRSVGRRLEQAAALEDAAVLLGRAGRHAEARSAYTTAVTVFTELGARWDVRRAQTRFLTLGADDFVSTG